MERFYLSRKQYLEVGQAVAAAVRPSRAYETEMQIRRWDGTMAWITLSGKGVVLKQTAGRRPESSVAGAATPGLHADGALED